MKIGDMVKLVTAHEWPTAIIVDVDNNGWFWVLQSDGNRRMWPPGQMELINESR